MKYFVISNSEELDGLISHSLFKRYLDQIGLDYENFLVTSSKKISFLSDFSKRKDLKDNRMIIISDYANNNGSNSFKVNYKKENIYLKKMVNEVDELTWVGHNGCNKSHEKYLHNLGIDLISGAGSGFTSSRLIYDDFFERDSYANFLSKLAQVNYNGNKLGSNSGFDYKEIQLGNDLQKIMSWHNANNNVWELDQLSKRLSEGQKYWLNGNGNLARDLGFIVESYDSRNKI